MLNCCVGAVEIAGISRHVLSPALSPGKGSKPDSCRRACLCLFPCMANGSFSLLDLILGFTSGEAQPLLMFLAWCDARWSQVSRVPGASGVNPAVRGTAGDVKSR